MINIIKSILNNIIKDIDAGNSNITEEDEAKRLVSHMFHIEDGNKYI